MYQMLGTSCFKVTPTLVAILSAISRTPLTSSKYCCAIANSAIQGPFGVARRVSSRIRDNRRKGDKYRLLG